MRLGPHFLDAGLDAQQVAVAAGTPEAAPGLHDGQAEPLRDVLEGLLGRQAAGP